MEDYSSDEERIREKRQSTSKHADIYDDLSIQRQDWLMNVYDSHLECVPSNPMYFWTKDDVFDPSLPGKVHLAITSMRFSTRGKKEVSMAIINIGEGVYCRGEENKPDRVYIPFEIQVCCSFRSMSRSNGTVAKNCLLSRR